MDETNLNSTVENSTVNELPVFDKENMSGDDYAFSNFEGNIVYKVNGKGELELYKKKEE